MFRNDKSNRTGREYINGNFVYGDTLYTSDDYMDERWWFIEGAPGYMISDCGRIWSQKTQQMIKPKPMDRHGHLGVCLKVNGKPYYEYLHRLMAKAFIPNPNNYPIVRHLNDNPSDNSLDNLDWGTQKDNMSDCARNGNAHFPTQEEREIGLSKMRTPIIATNIHTGEQMEFAGQGVASRCLRVPQANIWKVLNNHRSHAGGYTFEYLKVGDDDECY